MKTRFVVSGQVNESQVSGNSEVSSRKLKFFYKVLKDCCLVVEIPLFTGKHQQ